MGNIFHSCATTNLPNMEGMEGMEGMVGSYERVSCEGMEELLKLQTGFVDKRAEIAGSNDTPCTLTVELDNISHTWTMKYKRSNMEQVIMFKMPNHPKCPVSVSKVINVPARSTPQPKMEIVRDVTGRSMMFYDKKMDKGTIRMERKFSEDMKEVTQVVTLRREEVSCIEKFTRVEAV